MVDYKKNIQNLLKKYFTGINITPLELVTLYILHEQVNINDTKYYLNRETLIYSIQLSLNIFAEMKLPVVKEDTLIENLIRKNLLIFSSTSINTYYLSELSHNIINSLTISDMEDQSDIESDMYSIFKIQ
jgi:hypothetical protein